LVARWLGVGFIHGVMNTDNTSIAGETIDYGPCAFMDRYHPQTVFSSIDHAGRYAFANQPAIVQWNLAQLAQCLLPIIEEDEDQALAAAQHAIDGFPEVFETALTVVLAAKLGLTEARDGDLALAQDLMSRMADNGADFTLTFRGLADLLEPPAEPPQSDALGPRVQFQDPTAFDAWAETWQVRLADEPRPAKERAVALRAANPSVIPRNHLVEEAIRAAEDNGDLAPFEALLSALANPYRQPPRPDQVVRQTFCGT
jgi:serine/tyrosine/threonine adenylyltransferase